MALASSKVASGETIESAHLNTLRDDVTANHTHAAGEGGTVSHADLSDGALGSTYLTHAIINNHVQGNGTDAEPDAAGGSEGVHGLASGVSVAGSMDYQSGGAQLVIQAGNCTLSGDSVSVSFDTPFTTLVSVVCTLKGAKSAPDRYPSDLYVESEDANGFTVKHSCLSFASHQVYWIAVGTVS